ncbi:hypothetical protein EON65_45690, partial [archaeon]
MTDFNKLYITSDRYAELCATIEQQTTESKVLILVRGLPGQGKSSLGKRLAERFQGIQFESDANFMVAGEYKYDASLVGASHELTQSHARQAMLSLAPVILVTNTFTRHWEYEPYTQLAEQYGYVTVIFDLYLHIRHAHAVDLCLSPYLVYLSGCNVHDVPPEKILEMAQRYEFSVTEILVLPCHALGKRPRINSAGSPLSGGSIFHAPDFRILDTGYYLALEIVPADGATRNHNNMFLACLHAYRWGDARVV